MPNRSRKTKSPSQTKKLGEVLAKEILKKRPKEKALVVGLKGDLGGGKTTFLQGFAKGLGIKQKITSPTFLIIKTFPLSQPFFRNFFHIDCYRIEKEKEILSLGFREIINNPKNIVAIEWVDKIEKLLPQDSLILKFDLINQKTRKIKRA